MRNGIPETVQHKKNVIRKILNIIAIYIRIIIEAKKKVVPNIRIGLNDVELKQVIKIKYLGLARR